MNIAYFSLGIVLTLLGIVLTVAGMAFGIPLIILGLLVQLKGRGKIERIFSLSGADLPYHCNVLKVVTFSYWIMLILGIVVISFDEGYWPPEVAAFEASQFETTPIWIFVVGAGFLLLNLFGSIGLFALKKWGSSSFLAGYIGMLILSAFAGATLYTPISGALDMALDALAGMIICMAYFSSAKENLE